MQPVLTQVPPKSFRSISATDIPAPVNRPARDGPACPAPITIASKRRLIARPPRSRRDRARACLFPCCRLTLRDGRPLTVGSRCSRRQLLAGLLPDDVVGVPVRPVRVGLAGLLLVL